MNHASLFSGIGGFDLAAEQVGWKNVFNCEVNEFAKKVLKHYWPNAIQYDDIKRTNFAIHRGTIDVLTGGFPCQPYSIAGKRLGKQDERHLWPEMLRVIREVRPTWVVAENVLGLISWNGGLVFEEVQTDLESEGYEVQPFVLPACGVNAPHRRYRVWFVAHRANTGIKEMQYRGEDGIYRPKTTTNSSLHGLELLGFREGRSTQGESESNIRQRQRIRGDIRGDCEQGVITNSESQQSERMQLDERESCQSKQRESGGMGCEGITESVDANSNYQGLGRSKIEGSIGTSWTNRDKQSSGLLQSNWENFPTFSPICTRNDGLSSRLVGITFPRWRNESIKAMGNAIVPQVALEIFKAIQKYEFI